MRSFWHPRFWFGLLQVSDRPASGMPIDRMRNGLTLAARVIQLAICVAGCGCAINSNGTMSPGFRGSQLWHENAPAGDVAAYYDKMTFEELCELWWLSHRSGSNPSAAGDKARLDAFARREKGLPDCAPRYRF